MSDETALSALETALCEVCAKPLPAGAEPVRVGACEFPFHVHPECAEQMGPVATEVAEMCEWVSEQPEGLLWLGSWDKLDTSAARGEGEPGADPTDAPGSAPAG